MPGVSHRLTPGMRIPLRALSDRSDPRRGGAMRIVVLDDFHRVYGDSGGVARLRERADVTVYTDPPASRDELVARLRGVPIVIANRERTHFPVQLFPRLP